MKKKIVAVILAAAMAISMAGCAGNGPAKEKESLEKWLK